MKRPHALFGARKWLPGLHFPDGQTRHGKHSPLVAPRFAVAAVCLLALTFTTPAEVVSIDFKGNTGAPNAIADADGVAFFIGQQGEWNALDITHSEPMFAPLSLPVSTSELGLPLLDGDGNATTVSFTLNPADAPGIYMWYDTGDANLLGRDLIFLNPSTSGSISWSIEGLTPNQRYNLAFYAQRQNGVWVNPGIWTIGDISMTNVANGVTTSGVYFGATDGTISSNSVTADAGGIIRGTFSFHTGEGGSGFSAWSGLQLQKAQQSAPPSIRPIIFNPTNRVYSGSPLTLTADAVGTLPLRYQWRVDKGSGPRNIQGATDSTYSLLVQESDQGTYDVVVENAYGTETSTPAVLTVLPASAPLVVAEPAPSMLTVPLGGLLELQSSMEGTLPITYQWQIDAGQGFVNVSGATNSTLRVFPVHATNHGSYRLFASNTSGSVTSGVAQVAVVPEITLSVIDGPESGPGLDLEGNFVLAEYYGGTDAGPLLIGDAAFLYSDRITASPWEGNTPSFGTTTAERNLAQISDSVMYGKDLEFYVDTTAGVKYKLQLFFHEPYHNRANARLIGLKVAGLDVATSLDLAALGAHTGQPKTVVLSYAFTGDGNPLPITLSTVLDNAAINALTLEDIEHPAAPAAVSALPKRHVYVGTSVQLEAPVSGSSPKTYQWQVGTNGAFVNLIDGGLVSGATTDMLSISATTTANTADYRVVVSNAAGSVTVEPGRLSVYELPTNQLVNLALLTSRSGPAVMGLAPDVWNSFNANNLTVNNLVDSTGARTPIGMTVSGTSGGGNFGDGGLPLTPETAGVLTSYDYVSENAMTISLTGLDPAATYDLVVFTAGNQVGQGAVLSGAIVGTNILTTRSAFVSGDNYARNPSSKPDANGTLTFQVANDPTQGQYGAFNGLQLRNNLAVPPEVRLAIEKTGADFRLTWPRGTLLESQSAAGTYQPVPGNPQSPYTVTPGSGNKFYRVQLSP